MSSIFSGLLDKLNLLGGQQVMPAGFVGPQQPPVQGPPTQQDMTASQPGILQQIGQNYQKISEQPGFNNAMLRLGTTLLAAREQGMGLGEGLMAGQSAYNSEIDRAKAEQAKKAAALFEQEKYKTDMAFKLNNAQLNQQKFGLDKQRLAIDIEKARTGRLSELEKNAYVQELAFPNTTPERRMQIAALLNPTEAAKNLLEKPKMQEISVPGFDIVPGQAPSKDDAKKLKDVAESKKIIEEQLNEYKDLVKKHGSETIGGNVANKMNQRITNMTMNLKTMEQLGVLNPGDTEQMEKMIPNATDFVGSFNPYRKKNVEEGLQVFQNYLDSKLTAAAQARGYAPKNAQPGQTPIPGQTTGFKFLGFKK